MIQLALIPLLFVAVMLFRRYGIAAAAHPGVWFSAAWTLAIGCYTLLDWFNGVPVHNQEQVNELLMFLVFTSGAFLLFARLFPGGRRRLQPAAVLEVNTRTLLIASVVGLIAALVNWYVVTGGSVYSDAVRQQWLLEIPTITAWMWWPYLATFPAAFVSAYLMASNFVYRSKQRRQIRFASGIAIAAGMFWSFGTGGRQAFGIVLLHAIAAYALSLRFTLNQLAGRPLFGTLAKTATVTLSLVAVLSVATEVTGRMREDQQGASRSTTLSEVPYLGAVSIFVDYMAGPIATYQSYGPAPRRDLSETGSVALAGLQEFGIAYLAGWRPPERLDTNPERAKTWLPLFSGTRCVFYDLVADFGDAGAVLAVTLLVVLSQILFSLTPGPRMILRTAPLVMMLMFWGYSHQLSLLMYSTAKWLFISFGLWDVVHNSFHRRSQHSFAGAGIQFRRPPRAAFLLKPAPGSRAISINKTVVPACPRPETVVH